jgi:hypothetical protein
MTAAAVKKAKVKAWRLIFVLVDGFMYIWRSLTAIQ